MADFNSKYTGEQVENLLDQVASGEVGGGGTIVSETDPIFSASPAASITEAKKAEWDNKVDKVTGKGLSTEDFTSALKIKLEGLSNYDDTELSEAISTLRSDFDKLVSGDTTTAIKTFNEVIAFLDGIQDTQDLSSIVASIEQQIAGKMDKVTLAKVATSGSYNDLSNKPTIPSAVTESTVSGWGFTKNTGTYSKPSGGIPKTDLASAVQTSLGKADTALQSYTEKYTGTVTGVKINGSEKTPDANGLVDLGTIEGGGGSSSDGIVMKVETIIPSGGTISFIDNDYHTAMKANTIYIQSGDSNNDWLESLGIEDFEETDDAYAEYVIIFTFNSSPFLGYLSLPEYVKWANGEIPNIEENVIYELNIARSAVAGEISYCAVLTPFKSV